MVGQTFDPGAIVAGKYRVEEQLGRGGFGVVYRATQLSIGRPIALKTILDPTFAAERDRFRREAELAQRLEHPNTVRLYDFGESDEGVPFIALELLKGQALDAVVAREGRLAPARVTRIGAQILKSLMEAHGLGIVHRDIKPANIFLCDFPGETDFVKVLDFGIAKGPGDEPRASLTPAGIVLGTPAYMAPEQFRGARVTAAADLYALGLVLAELLAGEPVYKGEIPLEIVRAQLAPEPAPLPKEVLDSPLGELVVRATQKDPAARFVSAAQFLEALSVLESAAKVSPANPAKLAASTHVSAEGATVLAMEAVPDLAPPPAVASPRPVSVSPVTVAATEFAMPAVPRAALAAPPVAATAATELAMPAFPSPGRAAPAPPTKPRVPPATEAKPRPRRRLGVMVGVLLGLGGAGLLGRYLWRRHRIHELASESLAGRHFAPLTAKQIRARVEALGYPVVEEKPIDQGVQLVISGVGRSVCVVHAADLRAAQAIEVAYVRQGGSTATARDGTCVLHVELLEVERARALLEQITEAHPR